MPIKRTIATVSAVGMATLAWAGCGSSSNKTAVDVGSALPAAYTATLASKSAKVNLNLSVTSGSTKIAAAGQGEFDFAAKTGQLQLTISGMSLEEVLTQGEVYIHLPAAAASALGGKPWVGVPTGGLSSGSSLGGADPSQALALLESQASNVTKVGTEQVDGVSTTHYRAQLDLSKVKVGTDPAIQKVLQQLAQSAAGHPVFVDAWVDSQGRARRISTAITLTTPAVTSAVTMDFSDYGVGVHVTAPPASQVSNIPLDQLLSPTPRVSPTTQGI